MQCTYIYIFTNMVTTIKGYIIFSNNCHRLAYEYRKTRRGPDAGHTRTQHELSRISNVRMHNARVRAHNAEKYATLYYI